MTDLMSIGRAAIRTYNDALSVTSDNIANSQTPGYVRRSAQISQGSAANQVTLYTGLVGASGVQMTGIARQINEWQVTDARNYSSQSSQSAETLRWHEGLEAALADNSNGIGAAIASVFDSADQLAANPTNTVLRNQMIGAVGLVADQFRAIGNSLASASQGIAVTAQQSINTVNQNLRDLVGINDALSKVADGSRAQATLLDERDLRLNAIANEIAINVTQSANGSVSITTNGPSSATLLDSNGLAPLAATFAPTGELTGFSVISSGSSLAVTPTGGASAGLLDAQAMVSSNIAGLDQIALDFSQTMNSFQQNGLTNAGSAGAPMLSMASGATSMTVLIASADDLAVASASSSNGNLLDFGTTRSSDPAATGWAQLAAAHSQATAAARQRDDLSQSLSRSAAEMRDMATSVDLDAEAADLVRYQQAYQGAARILQVAREMMQTIFNSI